MASVEAALGLLFLTDRPQEHLTASEALVLKALRLAPDHPWAHFTLATLLINTTNRMAQGVAECQRALALDGNLPDAHVLLGIAKFYNGCGADTEIHVKEALRLSPRDVFACHWMSTAGFAKLQIAEDAEAVAWFARGLEANRTCILPTLQRSRFLGSWRRRERLRRQDLSLIPPLRSVESEVFQPGGMKSSLREPSASLRDCTSPEFRWPNPGLKVSC